MERARKFITFWGCQLVHSSLRPNISSPLWIQTASLGTILQCVFGDRRLSNLRPRSRRPRLSGAGFTPRNIAGGSREIAANLIKNLVKDIEGNTLVLFNYIEKHGEPLHELINNSIDPERKIFFVHGGTDVEDREEVRQITETENNAVIIASYGTFSTGINIKRLHNIIFASPSKSRIRNLQSIGRVLRKGEGKDMATLYDIADDIGGQNYTLKHLNERVNIYNDENFKYEVIRVNLRAN